MKHWPLCLHPECHADGIQAVYRGLCDPCYKTVLHVLRQEGKYHIDEEQLIREGKLLPRHSAETSRRTMEYGARIEWFLSGKTALRAVDQERQAIARLGSVIARLGGK